MEMMLWLCMFDVELCELVNFFISHVFELVGPFLLLDNAAVARPHSDYSF